MLIVAASLLNRRSVTVNLQPSDAQASDTMAIKPPLPGMEFFFRQLKATARFLKTNGAAAHRSDNSGFASNDPAFYAGRRQVRRNGAIARQCFASVRSIGVRISRMPARLSQRTADI